MVTMRDMMISVFWRTRGGSRKCLCTQPGHAYAPLNQPGKSALLRTGGGDLRLAPSCSTTVKSKRLGPSTTLLGDGTLASHVKERSSASPSQKAPTIAAEATAGDEPLIKACRTASLSM